MEDDLTFFESEDYLTLLKLKDNLIFLVAKQLYKLSMSVRPSPKSDLSEFFFFNLVNAPANK